LKLKLLSVKQLRPHRLSLSVYGKGEDVRDLAESVRSHGIRTPLTVLADERTVIKGKRRLDAARLAGLERVPCLISSLTEKLQIELDVLEDNRSREKTNEQKAREFRERKRIEESLARQRQKAGQRKGGVIAGRSRPRADSMVENLPPSNQVFAKDVPKVTLPTGSLMLTLEGKARDLAASSLGWTGRTAEKAEAVLEFAEKKRDPKLIALMNQKSVNAAYAALKKKRDGVNAVPPFTPHYSNVWNFARPTEGLGEDYPGRIPGDILRNIFWLYTRQNDWVVDLFAGGGVTMDAVAWWNAEAKKKGSPLWSLRQANYDLVPSRKGIQKHDASKPPYMPKSAKGAGLIFLDPPYWKQKRGDYSDDATNLANLSLAEFHNTLLAILTACADRLREGGHVGLIIGATQSNGEFLDHSAHVLGRLPKTGLSLVQRVIVPYTTQQFSAADVAWAKKERKMLKGYRDLMIFGGR
jgi:hypothetical protein